MQLFQTEKEGLLLFDITFPKLFQGIHVAFVLRRCSEYCGKCQASQQMSRMLHLAVSYFVFF